MGNTNSSEAKVEAKVEAETKAKAEAEVKVEVNDVVATPVPFIDNDNPIVNTHRVSYAKNVGDPLVDIEPIPQSIEDVDIFTSDMYDIKKGDENYEYMKTYAQEKRFNLIKKLGFTGKNVIVVCMAQNGVFSLKKIRVRVSGGFTAPHPEHFRCSSCKAECTLMEGSGPNGYGCTDGNGLRLHGNDSRWTLSWGNCDHAVDCPGKLNRFLVNFNREFTRTCKGNKDHYTSPVFFIKHDKSGDCSWNTTGNEVDCDNDDMELIRYYNDGKRRKYSIGREYSMGGDK